MNDTVEGAVVEQVNADTVTGGSNDQTNQEAELLSGFTDSTATPNSQDNEQEQTIENQQQQPEKQEPQYKQITTQEYERLMSVAAAIDEIKSGNDKVFGKIGGVERSMQELESKLSASVPKGEPVVVTDEDFAELKEEFPDIAQLHVAGLNRILAKMGAVGGAPIDAEKIGELVSQHLQGSNESIIDSVVTRIEQRTELKAVGRVHPDWEQVGNTDEFVTWVQSLPPEEQQRIYEANTKYDSVGLINAFDKYKEFVKAKTNNDREQILNDAILPAGEGKVPSKGSKTEEEQMLEGFNS